VVRLETRPPNIEGEGQSPCANWSETCLRIRVLKRIIVGEVRGRRSIRNLLQAMNTGHDDRWETLHANNPREALSRGEIDDHDGGFSLPSRTHREMICASIDVIIQPPPARRSGASRTSPR